MLETVLGFFTAILTLVFGIYKYQTDRKDRLRKEEINSLQSEKKALQKEKEALHQEKEAYKFNSNILSSLLKFPLHNILNKVTNKIFKDTKAMRLIIFVAVNGKVEPKKVYAFFGRKNADDTIDEDYRAVEIDNHYRLMLHELEDKGRKSIDVLRMPEGLLKNIYFNEEISYSYLKFLKRYSLNENDDAIVYMSIATDNVDDFTKQELTKIDLEVGNHFAPLIDKIVK